MKHLLRAIAPVACAFALTWTGHAQVGDVTPEAVRDAFTEAGFSTSNAAVDTSGVASFTVEANGMLVVRVFVYPTAGAALAAHHEAHRQEEAGRNMSLAFSDDTGPQLLSGYGLSLWRQNVALIQVAPADDTGAYPQEIDCAPGDLAPVQLRSRTLVASAYAAPVETLLGLIRSPSL